MHVLGATTKIIKVMAVIPKISTEGGIVPAESNGEVSINNVEFTYPSRPDVKVLENVTLKIEANKTYAIVGQSGCGKSSTMALMERFYDPQEGNICYDKNNIKDLDVRWLKRQVAIVS